MEVARASSAQPTLTAETQGVNSGGLKTGVALDEGMAESAGERCEQSKNDRPFGGIGTGRTSYRWACEALHDRFVCAQRRRDRECVVHHQRQACKESSNAKGDRVAGGDS